MFIKNGKAGANVTTKHNDPEEHVKLLRELIEKHGQGIQKTFVRRMWAVHEELGEYANPSELRMMFFTSSLTCCTEGIKLLASFVKRIGVVTSFRLVQKLIIQYGATSTDCNRYGEVFKTAWKMAECESNYDLKEEIETDIISPLCYNAIFAHKPYCAKYKEILVPFAHEKKSNKNLDAMMTSRLNSCMYKGLAAPNDIVRSSAADVFYLFYPLVESDSEDMKKSLEEQYKIMFDLCTDQCTSIRAESVRKTLKVLSEFWLLIPKDTVRKLMALIIDKLSRDSVVAVRSAVFEGMEYLVVVPSCMNAFEHAMKCICPRGINDKSDRVRLVTFHLLNHLKNHRFINVFDIISRDEVIARLHIEPVENVRKLIVPIMHILLPISKSLNENYYRPRINYIIGKSRLAILTYFRLLYTMKIIDAEVTAKLIEMLLLWAYRYLRKKSGPVLSEDSEGYKRARAYLECALILYTSSRSEFSTNEQVKAKTKIEGQFAKLVKEIFEKYRDTPIMGTATAISSSISKEVLKGISHNMFAMLENDEVPTEAIEPFLESASHFNIDNLFDSVEKGLDSLSDLIQPNISKKSKKGSNNCSETLSKSLQFLKYITKSYNTVAIMSTRDMYRIRFDTFVDKIDTIRNAIDLRLENSESTNGKFIIDDDSLLLALELRFVLPIFSVSNAKKKDDPKKEEQLLHESMRSILSWFNTNIAEKINSFSEENHEFLIRLTKAVIECINIGLSSWNFSLSIEECEDDEGNENDENMVNSSNIADKDADLEGKVSIPQIISRIIVSFCNSDTPIDLFSPVLRVAGNLSEDEYSECHDILVNVMKFAPKWLKRHFDEEEEIKIEETAEKEIVESLRVLYRKILEMEKWTESIDKKFAHQISLIAIVFLTDAAFEVEFEDPRSNDYIAPQWVSIMVQKFACKEKRFSRCLISQISKLLNSPEFIGDEIETNVCLIRLAAVIQLLRIIQNSNKQIEGETKEIIGNCKMITNKYFDGDLQNVESCVVNSLRKLLDMDS